MKLEDYLDKAARILAAVLLCGTYAVPARALSYGGGLRYIDLDTRGSRGQVQEYDGKYYRGAWGDLNVSNEGSFGLFDLSATELGSGEERYLFNLDFKDGLKMDAKYDTLHHRLNYIRTGQIVNGFYTPNGSIVSTLGPDENLVMRRSETEFNFIKTSISDPRHWLTAKYWRVDKFGSTYATSANYLLGRANVDNATQFFTVGLGKGMGEKAAANVDLTRAEFSDRSVVRAYTGAQGNILKPTLGASEMTGGEFKFRYDPSRDLAVTGGLTGRRHHSIQSDFSNDVAVASLNAAYKATEKLRLLSRLYFRGNQVRESQTYFALNEVGDPTNKSQLDKNEFRGTFSATYKPVEKVSVKGEYKLEYRHRRDPVDEIISAGGGFFYNGFFIAPGQLHNDIAGDETRHNFTVATKIELPFGAEAEASYKRLQANRPTFVNQGNKQDDLSGLISVPLPSNLELTLLAEYSKERNDTHQDDRRFSSTRNVYRGALDWAPCAMMFLGADGSYDSLRYFDNLYFGSPGAAGTLNFMEPGAVNRQNNTTTGAHVKVLLPKGFVVNGSGSYTWSRVTLPLHMPGVGFTIDDYSPQDVRIARGTVGVEYTPARFKDWTAMASYRVDDWVDKIDNSNTGRASVTQLGVKAKF